ncbi:MAG: DUF885 family protein [Xanthomonadales bacterium]|nr:DUF885 family protein [Xanthomonadales bacterium]
MNRRVWNKGLSGMHISRLGKCLLAVVMFLWVSTLQAQTQGLIDAYMDHWKDFYPSAAFSEGQKSAAWRFEDFSEQRVSDWLLFNNQAEETLLSISDSDPLNERVDAQVLLRQVRLELELWEQDDPLTRQPQWYTGKISEALTYVLVSDRLSQAETFKAVSTRLEGVSALCRLGIENIKNGNPARTQNALKSLQQTIGFYENKLLAESVAWTEEDDLEGFREAVNQTMQQMRDLASHINDKVLPVASVPDKFGPEVYKRKLAIFSDNNVTPENLPVIALQEIDRVRELMLELSGAWWLEEYQDVDKPSDQALLDAALAAMEEDREDNRQDFLRVFKEATEESIDFVIRHELATVPANRNIIIDLLPSHSPFARIGGVFPPGPFDPDAKTLLYLPSIPDDAPEEEKDGFYRSFNNHFNRMIIAHELWPGHDMQFKVGLLHASKVRGLFSNPYYSEGWASFVEVVMLEAGWGDGNKLTRLAHLRKRLENATRAYISVMVHTQGWSKERVIEFASTRGLLPAQFAENLWNRVSGLYMSLQLTSYFVGYHGFDALWQEEQQRLGEDFVTRDFVDRVLATGSVPMSALREIVQQ